MKPMQHKRQNFKPKHSKAPIVQQNDANMAQPENSFIPPPPIPPDRPGVTLDPAAVMGGGQYGY